MHWLPRFTIGVYLIASTVTFIAYAIDKAAAKHNHRRTPENTLHFFSLVGGWPGALLAQRILHHKSKRKQFQLVFWTTVFINCFALAWLYSEKLLVLSH